MDDELENTFLRLTALDVPLNIHIDENTIVTVPEVHQPPFSATEPAPTQPYIETDLVPSPVVERTLSSRKRNLARSNVEGITLVSHSS
jgi:hypothetical protein